MNLGILASGNLGFITLQHIHKNYNIVFICTDKGSSAIIEFGKVNNIKTFVGNPRTGKINDFLKDIEIDLLISVNYLFIINKNLIDLPKTVALNIHGSLLPKYRGRTPHVWAIINNERTTGLTVHAIDEGCDTGNILLQKEVEIGTEDTGADILKKFTDIYPSAILEAIEKIKINNYILIEQNNENATYFGKRTPEDGEINWQWQKERIKNWVRAQAKPYPGAFTFYKGRKIIIHKVTDSDLGFSWDMQNGKILEVKGNIVIKTPNGALALLDYEADEDIEFVIGECFCANENIERM